MESFSTYTYYLWTYMLIILSVHIQSTLSQTDAPSRSPTAEPTSEPTLEPTENPTLEPTESSPVTTPGPDGSPAESDTFIEEYQLYFIIGGAVLYCICLVCVAFFIRHKHEKTQLNSEVKKINDSLKNGKDGKGGDTGSLPDEQRPMTGSQASPSPSVEEQKQGDGTYDYTSALAVQQSANATQLQQMQQMSNNQNYSQYTNFTNPYHIAAYQALQYCPPINHDGFTWKNLDHMQPNQRMMQLMHQQQYIQQMANQTAIAMAYFLEQQNKMSQLQQQQQKMSQSPVPSNMNMDYQGQKPSMNAMKHRQKVASVSSVAHDEVHGNYPMSLPQQNMNSNQNMGQYPMSMPDASGSNNNLMMPQPKKPERIDTMDNIFVGQDLPPSLAPEDKAILEAADDDNFKFGAPGAGAQAGPGGEKTFLELDPEDRPDVDIEIDDYKGGGNLVEEDGDGDQDNNVNVNNMAMMEVNIVKNGQGQDNINDDENEPMVPPPNPMEMHNLNVVGAQPNMRKLESLPGQIPDLPFANDGNYDENYQEDADGYYYEDENYEE